MKSDTYFPTNYEFLKAYEFNCSNVDLMGQMYVYWQCGALDIVPIVLYIVSAYRVLCELHKKERSQISFSSSPQEMFC